MNSNPNPNYKPPMSKPPKKLMLDGIKSIYSFSLSINKYRIDFVFEICNELYFRLEKTIQYKDFLKYCCYNNSLDIELKRKEDFFEPGYKPEYHMICVSIPIIQYLDFIASNEFHIFLAKFLSLANGDRSANYEPENLRLYSGKVVCVDARTNEFTKGRIYEVKNGRMKTDLSHIVEPGDLSPYTSFENLTLKLASKFIELVE